MSLELMVHWVIVLVAVAMIAGILSYLVTKAPFIKEEWKATILWVILALCGMAVIFLILIPLATGGSSGWHYLKP